MTQELKQSTAVNVLMGPFVDVTDANTAEADVILNACGTTSLLKHGSGVITNIALETFHKVGGGWYNLALTNLSTNTLGLLTIGIHDASLALPVMGRFMVLDGKWHDAKYGAGANIDLLDTAISTVNTTAGVAATNYTYLDMLISSVNTVAAAKDTQIGVINTGVYIVETNTDMPTTTINTALAIVNARVAANLDQPITMVNTGAYLAATNTDILTSMVNTGAYLAAVNTDMPSSLINTMLAVVNTRVAANLDLPITTVNTIAGTNAQYLDMLISAVNTVAGAKDTEIGVINTGIYQVNARSYGLTKGIAITNAMFAMKLSADHISPANAKTVWAAISKDGAAFTNTAGSPTQLGDGWWCVNFSAAEMGASVIAVRAVNANCDVTEFTIFTND